ncbi:hypothetical protein ACIQWN_20170 [Streptomyces vinaceus]
MTDRVVLARSGRPDTSDQSKAQGSIAVFGLASKIAARRDLA